MGNLCAIFHSRFKNLVDIIPSARKAQLLDYILLGWQSSNYRLKNSTAKWFMKPYAEIVADTGIPKSTLERYIKELADEGFIIRRQALYNRLNANNIYTVKKGTYMQITDKLLVLLEQAPIAVVNVQDNGEVLADNSLQILETSNHNLEDNKEKYLDSTNNEGTDPLKMRGSIIRDLYTSSINTINQKKLLKNVDNHQVEKLVQQFQTMQALLSEKIQEELPESVKKRVLGTFFNLCFKHQRLFSNPKQVAAEYLYALTNHEFYMPKVLDINHRNNILAKLLRQCAWKTPKGFYKYYYLGAEFKNDAEREQDLYHEKLKRELFGVECPILRSEIEERMAVTARDEARFKPQHLADKTKTLPREIQELKTALLDVKAEIRYQGIYLSQLEQAQDKNVHLDTIQAVKKSLDKLSAKQASLEMRLQKDSSGDYALSA